MTDALPSDNDTPDAGPEVFVVQVDCSVASTRMELLARLRHPKGDGLHTSYWRFETKDAGAVLAERNGGEVIIHADVCREMLGEEV
jgi:hypothetical protein